MRLANKPEEIWRRSDLRSMTGASTPVDLLRWTCRTRRSPILMLADGMETHRRIGCRWTGLSGAEWAKTSEENRDHFGQKDTHSAPIFVSLFVGDAGCPSSGRDAASPNGD